ncbi:hypothetical protein [Variovorax sp. LG9.2]|uniref:toxin-antitoxin system YwqK family antitoxin n=1 Tax=Variovorax sp. LG9.2 TaxID=3048626 RepID=UPI002B232B98|nr:hypothetical protein [Variovorax sp. LG9.2]MEB0057866.1 hypothetical protein [Variovorax sp. LG9.2]
MFGRAQRLAFIGAWLVGAAGAAHAIQDCELDGAPINTSNGNTTAGKTGLIRCKDRDSGEVQREQQLQNGVFMGLVRYYEKGKLLKEHSVNAKGNMDGRAREFVPATGQVLRDALYSDGSEVGLVRGIYPSGQLRRLSFASSEAGSSGERAYVEYTERGQLSALRCADKPVLAPVIDDSKLCGFASAGTPSQVELFDGKGTLRMRVSYAAGKRVRNENLYDNGKPQTQDEIVGNQRTERRFSSEGVKRREVLWLLVERGAVKQREQEFSEQGSLVRDQRWTAAAEPLIDDSFYLNGQPRSKSVYAGTGDARTVDMAQFHDNGQRSMQGRYLAAGRSSRQMPIGTHQSFDDKGVLVAESVYDDKGRVTRERAFDENGKLQRDDEVFEDGSRKAFAK